MTKFTLLSRMPKADKKHTKEDKQRRVRRGRGDGDNDDVDHRGNVHDLIDYGHGYYVPVHPSYVYVQSKRPVRKASVVARQKISKHYKVNVPSSKVKTRPVLKNTIHYPNVTRIPITSYKKKVDVMDEEDEDEEEDEEEDDDEDYDDEEEDDDEDYDDEEEEDEEEEEDDEEEEDEEDEEEEDEEEEDDDEEEEDDDDEEEEEEEDDEEEEEDEEKMPHIIQKSSKRSKGTKVNAVGGMGKLLFALMNGGMDAPQKYNLKKEPEIVQKFVKLLTEPNDENPIDSQICQFKQLTDEKQQQLVVALQNRPQMADTGIPLMLKIVGMNVSTEVKAMILSKYHALQNMDTSTNEYYKQRTWLEKVVSVPFGICKELPVRLEDGSGPCGEFMRGARKFLDDATYGQEDPKLQIMQFISTKIANPHGKGMSLLLVGPPGIGKTTIIKNGIAKALGWPFQFISLGGDSDASSYTGHQLVYESSHCGKIVNSLVASKSMSTVMMFDEVDKLSQTPKGEEIMNLLIHLTDPVQNSEFEDKYLAGIPIDLSKVMFVFSANDIQKIDRVLLDRMIVIDLKGYDLKQKTVIGEQYLVPEALREVNLLDKVSISKDILTSIIQEYASEEKGVRELKRCIDQIVQKINMLRMYNSPELPFHIPHFSLPFIVKKDHIKMFLKKKEVEAAPFGMYL